MDISPPYSLDPEGNCRTFFFFERHFAYPFLAFRPSKSAEDFTASVDLLREFIRLLCPGISLIRLCGDYDPTWVVAGLPDSILNAHVCAQAHKYEYNIVPTPPHEQSLNLAEPNIRRLVAFAFAFANAVHANLNFILNQTDMHRGAQARSRLNLVDTPTGRMTRTQPAAHPTFHPSLAPQVASPGQTNPTPRQPPAECAP